MAKQLQKLELTWIGKGNEPVLEPRILIEDTSKSFGDVKTENMLINGDNLLALRALEQQFTGQVKCICVDPPYNTGSAFEHYDDGIEHSLWLSLITPRLKIMHKLLRDDGSIWVSIDDNECHYLKVLMDEVFGRNNFVTTAIWQKKYAAKADSKYLSESHDYILCFAKKKDALQLKGLPRTETQDARYKNPDNDVRGSWTSGDLLRNEMRDYAIYPIIGPNGKEHWPPPGTSWRFTKERFAELKNDNRIWFGDKGNNVPRFKRFLSDVAQFIPATTWWPHTDCGHNDEAKKEVLAFNSDNIFSTPKPERLIRRILEISTNAGDIVLDSFLGSGTTSAVAHKMKRKWIGIELGEHATTHCLPRLQKVVSGEDKGGITKAINWQGGGGFKFYTLAPSLIKKDKYGSEIINTAYNANMLAAAMAKQEGFRYSPDENNYWKQGFSSEKDFIFTTTQFITIQMLDRLAEELQPGESLLVCCKSFAKSGVNRHSNITIKKIPQILLGRCEFGKDDYSMNIVNLRHNEEEERAEENLEIEVQIKIPKSKKKKADDDSQPSLF